LAFFQDVDIAYFADDAAIIAMGHTTCLLEKAMNDLLEMDA